MTKIFSKLISSNLNIPYKTAEGYITSLVKGGLIRRSVNGKYINLSKQEDKETEGFEGIEET